MLKLLRAEQNLLGSFFELMYNMLKGDKAMDKIVLSEYNECKGAKLYRILKRDGFLNILPYDSTEQGIEDYVNYLKSDSVRYE